MHGAAVDNQQTATGLSVELCTYVCLFARVLSRYMLLIAAAVCVMRPQPCFDAAGIKFMMGLPPICWRGT